MKRALAIKIAIYSLLTFLVIALLSGGYVWYTMDNTMDAMYEPLPSKEWVAPLFKNETELQPLSSSITNPAPIQTSQDTEPSPSPRDSEEASKEEQPRTELPIDDKAAERLRHPSLKDKEPFSMLLLGVDERASDRGRSDTMILLTINPKKKSAIAISIPRDTRTLMPDTGKYDKINHAYAFGGTSLSVEAVEQLLGVPIAFYMKTNMEGYVKIVDVLGGVDVTNNREFTSEYHFPEGAQHLNGDQALAYIRMRKEDPQGDFGRTERQRAVLSNAIDRVTEISSITKLPKLMSHLATNVRTNLTLQNMLDLALEYRPAIQNVKTLYLKGSGEMISGIYYYAVSPKDRQQIQRELLTQLGATK